MKFGVLASVRIDEWQRIREVEELGFDSAWVPDSQMIYSDCYAVLALAAQNTSRIRLGTGVSIADTRIAPVTAHSIATINQLAPGRVFLGMGTGNTAMRLMGMNAVKPKAFREHLRVVRGLLHGEEVDYTLNGVTRSIRFQGEEGYINTEHPVDIYVAANGPKAIKTAGAYGDGRITALFESEAVHQNVLEGARQGAETVGRKLPDDYHMAALTFGCVLRPGEDPVSDRVMDEIGPKVIFRIRAWWGLAQQLGSDDFIMPEVRDTWDEYVAYVEENLQGPVESQHQRVSSTQGTIPVEERRFVTPETIRATGGFLGDPDEIIEFLREQERMGLMETVLGGAREHLSDFARHVIERY